MSGKRILLLFMIAGLILAAVFGIYFYRAYRPADAAEAEELLRTFLTHINRGELPEARDLMTPGTENFLRDPGTALGERIHSSLSLHSFGNFTRGEDQVLTAEITLRMLDTLSITVEAQAAYSARTAENGPADDPDQVMADIYEEILSRDDLPLYDHSLTVSMIRESGTLKIIGDPILQKALEGYVDVILQ